MIARIHVYIRIQVYLYEYLCARRAIDHSPSRIRSMRNDRTDEQQEREKERERKRNRFETASNNNQKFFNILIAKDLNFVNYFLLI